MKRTTSAGGIVVNDEGLVVVVSQKGRTWSLPKGHVDPGEELLEAAKREVLEECGVAELELLAYLGSYTRPRIARGGGDDLSEVKEIHMYGFRTHNQALVPEDPNHPEARWVAPEEVPTLLTHEQDQGFFRQAWPALQSILPKKKGARS